MLPRSGQYHEERCLGSAKSELRLHAARCSPGDLGFLPRERQTDPPSTIFGKTRSAAEKALTYLLPAHSDKQREK